MLSFYLSFNIIQSKSINYSIVTGTLRDGEEISLFLKDHLKPGDCVVAPLPSYHPLYYYFKLYDIPVYYLETDPLSSQRMIIVVNTPYNQNVDQIIIENGLPKERLSIPENIQAYESAALYEVYWRQE
jgi:hypothetical protein